MRSWTHTQLKSMDYNILITTDILQEFLNEPQTGMVHSVYRHTVNLLFGTQIVALQTADSPVSPISILLPVTDPELQSLGLAPGDPCRAGGGVFSITNKDWKTLWVRFGPETEIRKTRLLPGGKAAGRRQDVLLRSAHQILSEHPLGLAPAVLSTQYPDDLVLRSAQKTLLRVQHRILEEDWNGAAKLLCSLLGLGGGLTPSGDDFLTGVLAGLQYLDPDHPLQTALADELRFRLLDPATTNIISAAFLQCAAAGHFSSAILAFFERTGDTGDALDTAAGRFLAIGHSSGVDSLSGIAFVLQHIHL